MRMFAVEFEFTILYLIGHGGEEKNSSPCQDSNSRSSSPCDLKVGFQKLQELVKF
jgi:hypothetical protein